MKLSSLPSIQLLVFTLNAIQAEGKIHDEDLHAHTMLPNPVPYSIKYDDGTITPLIRLRTQKGTTSAFDTYEETLDGFTVQSRNGIYTYVDVDDRTGRFIDTDLVVGVNDPKMSNVRQGAAIKRQKILEKERSDLDRKLHENDHNNLIMNHGNRKMKTASGTMKNLVIPFKFLDHAERQVPSKSDLSILMNNEGPNTLCPTGSVRDVYLESSFDQFDLQSTVLDWFTIDYTEEFCANGKSGITSRIHKCLTNLLDKVEKTGIDFKDYDLDDNGMVDGMTFFHSGYAAEWGRNDAHGTPYADRIWSHKWSLYTFQWESNGVRVYDYHINPSLWGTSGSSIGRIGVVAHETGHFLGLPDLYDYGDAAFGGGNGIGSYGIMGNSWGFDNSQRYPPHFSAWSKYELGWVTPTVVNTSGSYSLSQACTNPQMIKIDEGYPDGEYLLIENRQSCKFDKYIQGGLAIYHIDEKANNIRGFPSQNEWPTNGNHYRVALLQADGAYQMEQRINRGDKHDLFRAGHVDSIGPNGITGSMTSLHPNTNAYQKGNIIDTGVEIFNIGVAESVMTLDIKFDENIIPNRECKDSPFRMKFTYEGEEMSRNCEWVARRDSRKRCAMNEGIPTTCQATCGNCSAPVDSSLRIKFDYKDEFISRYCSWVAARETRKRCAIEGMSETCAFTCAIYATTR